MTHVELQKPVSGGLGFSVIGLKSENRGELGIFIQEIQLGSVAHWYVTVNAIIQRVMGALQAIICKVYVAVCSNLAKENTSRNKNVMMSLK